MENEDIKGFTYLILDTNWWMFLALSDHKPVLNELKSKIEDGSIILLVPSVVLKEWKKHKKGVLKKIEESITDNLKTIKNNAKKDAEAQYTAVCNFIEKRSKKIKVSSKVIHKAVNFALRKKAPFHRNKNSIADALIIFSTIEFLKKENNLGKDNAIFVSYNHTDFSETTDKSEEMEIYKDILHRDLEEEFNSIGLIYKRTFYNVINLSNELKDKLETRLEDEYWDYVEGELEWKAEVERAR
jgi:chaperonin cofactor prefoldin